MIKKIKAEQLQVGMYIRDFNCGWLLHPFYKSEMSIKDNNLISLGEIPRPLGRKVK